MSSGGTYILTSPTCALIMKRFSLCSLWIHISGLLIILTGYLIFGPIPQLDFIASLPLTVTGLALQGIGFSTCYIGKIIFTVHTNLGAKYPRLFAPDEEACDRGCCRKHRLSLCRASIEYLAPLLESGLLHWLASWGRCLRYCWLPDRNRD